MKTLRKMQINNTSFIGIIKKKEWGSGIFASPHLDDFFVVGAWSDFHDGKKSNIEGKQTIAVCKNREDAESLFDKHYIREKKCPLYPPSGKPIKFIKRTVVQKRKRAL